MNRKTIPPWTIAVARPLGGEILFQWESALPPNCELIVPSNQDKAELLRIIAQADFLIIGESDLSMEIIEAGKHLKLIQFLGPDPGQFYIDAAKKIGTILTGLRLLHWPAVAEHTMALMLTLAKRLFHANKMTREGFNPHHIKPQKTDAIIIAYNWANITGLTHLIGKTVGLIGLGRIGNEVARRCQAFEMKVIYFKRHRLGEQDEYERDVQYASLHSLLTQSDFVSLHLPYTPDTKGLLGKKELNLMKSSAFLINTSRGGIVDQQALYTALKNNQIAGAGLDVFFAEPLLPPDPLFELENVILTPHIGSGFNSIESSRDYYIPKYFENISRLVRGEDVSERVEP